MQHIIKKQVIDLSINKKLDAFHIQQLVSNYYHNRIINVLQEAFDNAGSEDETISIDRLELDLGIITIKDIEKGNWDQLVIERITEQLINVKYSQSSEHLAKRRSTTLSISEHWIFYMQHGYLPWNVLQIKEDWNDKALEAFASDSRAIARLRNLVLNNPNAITRIIFQHSEIFLKALIETLTAENQDALPGIIDEAAELILLLKEKRLKQNLWEKVLSLSASGEKNLTSSKITAWLIAQNFEDQEINEDLLKGFLLKNNIDAGVINKIREENKITPVNKINKDAGLKTDSGSGIDGEGIYVTCAGMVLLHPFLPRFFKNLKLVKEDSFVDELSLKKALHLLHYLCTGNTTVEEHELFMAKIMCDYPPEETIEKNIELDVEAIEEAESLLISVIQQWEILKNTSANGLREGFLQRSGKLFTKNNTLYLQVEASSIDVLLDQLPWNIGHIKLPWMRELLKVEWR